MNITNKKLVTKYFYILNKKNDIKTGTFVLENYIFKRYSLEAETRHIFLFFIFNRKIQVD